MKKPKVEYIYAKGPVTIIGQQKKKKSPLHIGVSVCGKGQKYDEELGKGIARNRCDIQPIAVVPSMTEREFLLIAAPVLCESILRSKQWNPSLPRIDKK